LLTLKVSFFNTLRVKTSTFLTEVEGKG